jgi:UDP-N-acetylmuramyl pentapeptide synthase
MVSTAGEDQNLLIVEDTFEALRDLGKASRARTGAKIIAITGSVGKTGTKEMLAAAFGAVGQTHASKASHNNHWGVPLSLASMHAGCDYGIFEIGMNHAGEITPLTQMVRPHLSIITTVAAVHLEHFGTEEKIADAKAEIFDGMEKGGLAVLNRDNQWFAHLSAKAKAKGLKICGFGEHPDADARMTECVEAANGSRIKARVIDEDVSLTIKIPGRHIATNALSVLLAVKLLGGDLKKAAAALEKIEPIKGRGLREKINIGDPFNPVTLIDESYNASPTAMRGAGGGA